MNSETSVFCFVFEIPTECSSAFSHKEPRLNICSVAKCSLDLWWDPGGFGVWVTSCGWGECAGYCSPAPSTPRCGLSQPWKGAPLTEQRAFRAFCRPALHKLSLVIRKAWEMKRSSTSVSSNLFLSRYLAHGISGTSSTGGNKWIWEFFKRQMAFFSQLIIFIQQRDGEIFLLVH